MRVLITGITGFVGSHMAELALAKGAEVFGTYRWRSRMDNIQHLLSQIRLIECDLRDAISVRNALKEAKPDWIFHLAAQSYVPTSWSAPADTMHINIIGTVNLFEALRQLDLDCRVQVAGSSEEYGLQFEHELPIKETNPLRPLSPYAVSKVAQDLLGWQYHRSYGMFIVRTRAFNHSGPRRGEVFVDSGFAWQIARIEAGLQEPVIYVGNLEAKARFHRCPRHRSGLLACAGEGGTGRSLQHRQRQGMERSGSFEHAARHDEGASGNPSRPRPNAPVRCARAHRR
jgi:GDP-4-dehydro-6-deoxy-D-mannose reductase